MIGYLNHIGTTTRSQQLAEWQTDAARINYAQCWEDADVVLRGLDVQPGDTCLSIASAGENTLALLTKHPERVIAVDLNPAQLACLELRVAAYRALNYDEHLEFVGSRPSAQRRCYYNRCRPLLSNDGRRFWDRQDHAIETGFASSGRLERYFSLFRRRVLPWIHHSDCIREILIRRSAPAREYFYQTYWDTARWRLLMQCFFSRAVMSLRGRESACFRYVDGSVSQQVLARIRHALTVLDPSDNPYVTWILTGMHGASLPFALRSEHYETIRANLDRLELLCESIESVAEGLPDNSVDRLNLSDVFEYMSEVNFSRVIGALHRIGRAGGRLAYWNLFVPRRRPESLSGNLIPLTELACRLHRESKTFFYRDFVVEEIV